MSISSLRCTASIAALPTDWGCSDAASRVSTKSLDRLVARGKNVQDLLQFIPQVRHTRRRFPGKRKRALVAIGLDLLAHLHPGARDREPVFIEQFLDPDYRLHIAFAVHALPGAALDGLQLRKFGFPEPKHVSRQAAQAGDFTDAEIELVRNDDFSVACRFFRRFLSEGHGGHFRAPVYAFLARAAPRDNPQNQSLVDGQWSLVLRGSSLVCQRPTTIDQRPSKEKPLKWCFSGEALGEFWTSIRPL